MDVSTSFEMFLPGSERLRVGLARLEATLQGYAPSDGRQQGEWALAGNQFFFRSGIHPTSAGAKPPRTSFNNITHPSPLRSTPKAI